MKAVGGFLADLKRRHIYRVAAVYAVVSWVLIQLVGNLTPMLRLPDWAGSFVFVLLIVGFPLALIFAWIQEPAAAPAMTTDVPPAVTTKLDWVLAGGVAIVIASILYESVVGSPNEVQAELTMAPQDGVISIAVLPLANLSGDPEQEFMSDGMADEITTALARVASLRVVGRSSAFQFKGQGKDLRAIGQALGASHLIDGSLRRAGTRVRVTAQLVRTEDGIELWTDSYERELTDLFAIQEDIAQAIAGALRAPLGLGEGERLVSSRTADVGSYEAYLRGRSLVRERAVAEAVTTLEDAVDRDPNFAPAWAMLSQAYRASLDYDGKARRAEVPVAEARRFVQEALEKGERAARRSIELDSRHDGGHAALAAIVSIRGEWAEAADLFAQAFALDPNNPEALYRYAQMQNVMGHVQEALLTYEQLRALEPLVPIYQFQTAGQLYFGGRNQAAIEILEATPDSTPARFYRNLYLARAYAGAGRFAESADALLALRGQPQASAESIEAAAALIRAPRKTDSPASLPDLGDLAFVYAYIGAEDRLFDGAERGVAIGVVGVQMTYWSPAWAPVRKTQRFKDWATEVGLVDHWRQRGWPDLCRPQGANDFACD